MTEEKTKVADRKSRDSEAHDKSARRKPWRLIFRAIGSYQRQTNIAGTPESFIMKDCSLRKYRMRLSKSVMNITKEKIMMLFLRLITQCFQTLEKMADMSSMTRREIQKYPSEKNNLCRDALNQ